MNTISVSEAKMKLSALVDSVKKTDEEVVKPKMVGRLPCW